MAKQKKPLKSLSQGRPPVFKQQRSISSKATRTIIRSHHTLEKLRALALKNGDETKANALARQIEAQGGIEGYQKASLIGQMSERGGDSSKILMEWLGPIIPQLKENPEGERPRMLEVGALSVNNACSKSHLFEMERIDLNSQSEGIKEQDFMDRPLPSDSKEHFDIISLSLVLNFVPDAAGKGDMLLRTLKFLKDPSSLLQDSGLQELLPSLFLVLPASCVTNSRYMDEPKLESILQSLGYLMVKKKLSSKLVYYLWKLETPILKRKTPFQKVEIRSGKDRNNFAIVLK